MAKFVDMQGDEWRIVLSIDAVAHINRETGVNLNDSLVRDAEGKTPFTRLADDPEQLGQVLYAACESQVKERGLSERDFVRRFDCDAIEAASAALVEALCDFFPKRLREPMHRARRKLSERIEATRPHPAQLEAIVDRAIDEALASLAT